MPNLNDTEAATDLAKAREWGVRLAKVADTQREATMQQLLVQRVRGSGRLAMALVIRPNKSVPGADLRQPPDYFFY